MTEYLIIVALIAVFSIGVVSGLGRNLKVGLAKISNALIGHSIDVQGATEPISRVNTGKTLNNFQEGLKVPNEK